MNEEEMKWEELIGFRENFKRNSVATTILVLVMVVIVGGLVALGVSI